MQLLDHLARAMRLLKPCEPDIRPARRQAFQEAFEEIAQTYRELAGAALPEPKIKIDQE